MFLGYNILDSQKQHHFLNEIQKNKVEPSSRTEDHSYSLSHNKGKANASSASSDSILQGTRFQRF